MPPYVLAHLSDPHLAPLPFPTWPQLAGKRLLGYLNWQRNRRAIHRGDVLAEIVRDLKANKPDHIAVTGDLVNISLPREFDNAREWLAALGPPADVTVIPGNHDAYVRIAAHEAERHWSPYMTADKPEGIYRFPFVRRRGPVALIGVSTAVPTAPFMASGELGGEQLERLASTLTQFQFEPNSPFRVVLIHHPPVSPAPRHKRLSDSAVFLKVIARCGAELVIHGHDHTHALEWLPGPDGSKVPAFGVPSASAAPGMAEANAGYNLYRIEQDGEEWRCIAEARGMLRDGRMHGLRQVEFVSRIAR